MNIWIFGVNHKNTSLEQREKLALCLQNQEELLISSKKIPGIDQIAFLLTCNRIEFYIMAESLDSWFQWFFVTYGYDYNWFLNQGYIFTNDQALHHMLRVAVGLDSMVIGENQILGQIKKSYQTAAKLGTLNGVGHKLFSWLLYSAKQIRTISGLGMHHVSVASIAVQWLKNRLNNWQDLKVMLVGSGETAELVAKYLIDCGSKNFYIVSRTTDHSRKFAANLLAADKVSVVLIDVLDINQYITEMDVVITATNCPLPFIDFNMLKNKDFDKILYLVDLAVPRNINANVSTLLNTHLIDLDALATIADDGINSRVQAATIAENMIEPAVKNFKNQDYELLIKYRQEAYDYMQHELQRGKKLLHENQNPELVLQQVCSNLLNKLLHSPTMWLKASLHEIKESVNESID